MITIQEAIHRIQQEVPGEIPADTVDQFKIGDPARALTGIVTTFMATCRVIEQTAAVGANLIITHEPTFFNHRDEVEWLQKDAVYLSKRRLLEERGITVWRFHDGWHAIQPDGILEGMLRKLDWKTYQDVSTPYLLHLPPHTLEELGLILKEKLAAPSLRVAGPRELVCQTAALIPGSVWGEMQVEVLGRPDVDVLICGEAPEWQTAEYVRDAVACGRPKGLIILGHERSEEAGMAYLVDWLGERLPEVPIHYLPAGDPIWFL